uniref:Fibroblast growth factor binding protein 1 n=1 Tax=Varanus komodoensis TaxID=61221 RepID=A0A8D2KRS4_VARKO
INFLPILLLRTEAASDNQNGRSQKNRGAKGSHKGKFTTKEKSECTWTLNEAETATLKIDCKSKEDTFSCEFSGNPSTCPQYAKNQKAFWKQITRSLKKQKNICKDPKSILKSKLCKTGPPTAHLRLVTLASQNPKEEKPSHHAKEDSLPAENKPGKASSDCVEEEDYIDQRKVAEEYCGESWLSLCNFFVAMIQDKKCN